MADDEQEQGAIMRAVQKRGNDKRSSMLRSFAAIIGAVICGAVAMAQNSYPTRNVIIIVPLALPHECLS